MDCKTSTSALRKPSNQLAVHIVEDHDEALPLVHRAIAAKQLPFSGNVLIHFDAHPDLLSPDIKADEIVDKGQLYSHTSIAEWILPAVYMGHIDFIVWLKPSWATQMPDGRHTLIVGRDKVTGHLRLATPLLYFISELLYAPESELDNVKTVPLLVVTITPLPDACCGYTDTPASHEPVAAEVVSKDQYKHEDCSFETVSSCEGKDNVNKLQGFESGRLNDLSPPATKLLKVSPESKSKPVNVTCAQNGQTLLDCSPVPTISKQLTSIISESDAWLLDIDLDFFSTGNPYRGLFTDEQYDLLTRLYKLSDMEDPTIEEFAVDYMKMRRNSLNILQAMWSQGYQLDTSDVESFQMTPYDIDLLTTMKVFLGTTYKDALIDEEYVHLAGMLTDLPVHLSTEKEVYVLTQSVFDLLRSVQVATCRPPSLVTIARSSDDEYTPPHQVEYIQDSVLYHMRQLYSKCKTTGLRIYCDYLDKYREHLYETPRDVCDCSYL